MKAKTENRNKRINLELYIPALSFVVFAPSYQSAAKHPLR
jgi:hypothetical protein